MRVKDSDTGDVLDWTMTAAPTADEAGDGLKSSTPQVASAAAEQHARRFSRWMWLTLGGVMLVTILGMGLFAQWNRHWVREDIRRTVLAEEVAALAGDTRAIEQFTAPGYSDWLIERLVLVERGQAAPVPAPLLQPLARAGEIISFTTFAPNIMQVNVARLYLTPAGTQARFILPQFYQYQNGWKRTPAPPGFSDDGRLYEGQRLTLVYFARDTEWISTLAPAWDEVLTRACAEWECADNFRITVHFLGEGRPRYEFADASLLEGPLLLSLLAYPNTTWLDKPQLTLPAPHLLGYPADGIGREAFQQATTLQMLAYAAQQQVPATLNEVSRNAFLFALTARLTARLGLDAPEALNVSPTNPVVNLHALWNLGPVTDIWDSPVARQQALHSALAILNILLQDQPLSVEQELFNNLKFGDAENLDAMLAPWLGLDPVEMHARLREVGVKATQIELPADAQPSLALSCVSGPLLVFPDVDEPVRFLSGPFLSADIPNWSWLFTGNSAFSPTGDYLMLNVSGQPAAVHLPSRTLTWLPGENESALVPPAWLSDTVLVYGSLPPAGTSGAPINVNFLDLAHPERAFPTLTNVLDYTLSPDGTRAAVVWPTNDALNGKIEVMPPMGGEPTPIGFGFAPIWVANGTALAFGQFSSLPNGDTFWAIHRAELLGGAAYIVRAGDTLWDLSATFGVSVIRLMELNALTSDVIVTGQTLLIPVENSDEQALPVRDLFTSDDVGLSDTSESVRLVGSPDGELLALFIFSRRDDSIQLMLVNAGSGEPRVVLVSGVYEFLSPAYFSADGQFLTFIAAEVGQSSRLLVVSTATGVSTVVANDVTSFAWSPTGHRLAIASAQTGVSVWEGVPIGSSPLVTITDEPCSGVWWAPS